MIRCCVTSSSSNFIPNFSFSYPSLLPPLSTSPSHITHLSPEVLSPLHIHLHLSLTSEQGVAAMQRWHAAARDGATRRPCSVSTCDGLQQA